MNYQETTPLEDTDYLTETLATEPLARMEIFHQMLYRLENTGHCRYVYHRLGRVLFGDKWDKQ